MTVQRAAASPDSAGEGTDRLGALPGSGPERGAIYDRLLLNSQVAAREARWAPAHSDA